MGGCVGTSGGGGRGDPSDSSGNGQSVSIGRNQPLKPEKPKWKSDIPLTDGQLRSKRDEFWDTAPAFEGRKEIWDALKAAAYALETRDHALAQAIVDGASISLPQGTLLDSYDELGQHYQLPIYVLSTPTNLIEEGSEVDSAIEQEVVVPGKETSIKFRLSSGKDVRMVVRTTDTVAKLKRQIQATEKIEPARQRWFFSGRVLSDKMTIEDIKLPKGYVVQIIISPQEPTPVDS